MTNNLKLSDNDLWQISAQMNAIKWRALGRTLGLEEDILLNVENAHKSGGVRECAYQMLLEWKVNYDVEKCVLFVSSVRSSSGYHGLIEIRQQPTFSDFSNSSDSKVKVKVKGPNMCYIFEKHWIQGYRI